MRAFISLAIIAGLGLPVTALAETAEEKGLRIALEADAYNAGYGDQVSALEMLLRNRYGDESKRYFRSKVLEYAADGGPVGSHRFVSRGERPRRFFG